MSCIPSPYCDISITVTSGLSYITGDFITLYCSDCNYISGQIVSYNIGTGALVFTPLSYEGTGTCCDWTINLSGAPGVSAGSNAVIVLGTGPNSSVRCGVGNTASGYFSFAGGGQFNTASGYGAFVGAGQCNIVVGTESFIGSGSCNTTCANSAFIGGGNNNIVNSQDSVIVGGNCNTVSGNYSGIGSGQFNSATGVSTFIGGGNCNTVSGYYASVISGGFNTITGNYSFVGGGTTNSIDSIYSFSGGGNNNFINIAGDYSFIGGGSYNCILSNYSTIGGGYCNVTCASSSTIGGGEGNTVSGLYSAISGGCCNTASGGYSTISGGISNTACGIITFVGGGTNNIASGNQAAILGGACNTASANYSGAFGCGVTNTIACSFKANRLVASDLACAGCAVCTDANGILGLYTPPSVTSPIIVLGAGANSSVRCGVTNSASACYSFAGGGQCNTASGVRSFVGGGLCNTASGASTFIGSGLCNNAIGFSSTISGGRGNIACGFLSTVSGGYFNTASGTYSFIGAGYCNVASGNRATVSGGGNSNTASGSRATVGGGQANTASANYSFIGGGQYNTASVGTSVIGGGFNNTASNFYASILGGTTNTASANYSTVSGGRGNTASGSTSTVSGGRSNIACGDGSFVGGGRCNTASGAYSGAFGCNLTASAACTFYVNNMCSCGNGTFSGLGTFVGGATINDVFKIYSLTTSAGVVLQGYTGGLRIAVNGSGETGGTRGDLLAAAGDFSGALTGTTATFSGQIISTLGNDSQVFYNNSATTGYLFNSLRNSVGISVFGVNNSTGGSLGTNTSANSAVFGNSGNAGVDITTNSISRLFISSTGTATFSSSVTATGLVINNNGEALRAYGTSPNVSFYNAANTTRGGYVNHDGTNMNIVADVGVIALGSAMTGTSATFSDVVSSAYASTNTADPTGGVFYSLQNTSNTNNNWSTIRFRDAQGNDAGYIGVQYVDHTNNRGDVVILARPSGGNITEVARFLGTGATTLAGALTGTSATFSGKIAFSANSGATASGQIGRDATYGMFQWASTGSTDDWTVFSPSLGYIMHVPTGTVNTVFAGTGEIQGGTVIIGKTTPTVNSSSYLNFQASNSVTNWQIGQNKNLAGALEFVPSTTGGGSTYSSSVGLFTTAGYFKVSNDGTYQNTSGLYHEITGSTNNNNILTVRNTHATGAYGPYIVLSGATYNNATNYIIGGGDAGGARFQIMTNGGLYNYSANDVNLSDETVKKDIFPMESQWEIFKNIEFSKFKYKDQTHDDFNYGVIAQQVLKVAPHFVNQDGFGNNKDLLSVYANHVQLNNNALFSWVLYSTVNGTINNQLSQGNLNMSTEDYAKWNDDDFAWDYVAGKLNLTIVGDYVPPIIEPIVPSIVELTTTTTTTIKE
jgi:hypothetical protein